MITKKEAIDLMKSKFPTLQEGSEENGYYELNDDDYNSIIESRAEAYLVKLAVEEEAALKSAQKAELLAKLGISEEEAKLLLS